jgi:hypothetical protein
MGDTKNDLRRWMRLVETQEFDLPTVLYHGTSSKHVKDILSVGLLAPNHWGTLRVARYFAKAECADSGGRPAIFAMPLADFHHGGFQVDENMIDFPVLTHIAGADHGLLEEQWEESAQDWQACLAIYESVIYNSPLMLSRQNIM